MGFLELFAGKSTSYIQPSVEGTELGGEVDADADTSDQGAVIMANKVIFNGQEYVPGDNASYQKFTAAKTKAITNNELIPVDGSTAYYPASSLEGRMEITKAEVQMLNNCSAEEANRAVNQIPDVKQALAQKTKIVYLKNKVASTAMNEVQSPEEGAVIKKSSTGNFHRGPRS